MAATEAEAEIGPDGAFRFKNVPPDCYLLAAYGNAYVKAARLGETASDGPVLDLRNPRPGASLTLTISNKWASISGKVADTKAGTVVALIPERFGGVARPVYANTEPDGSYRFRTVQPGSYKLAVTDNTGDETEEDAVAVELQPGERAVKNLERKQQ